MKFLRREKISFQLDDLRVSAGLHIIFWRSKQNTLQMTRRVDLGLREKLNISDNLSRNFLSRVVFMLSYVLLVGSLLI